jgi:hypothetical protein
MKSILRLLTTTGLLFGIGICKAFHNFRHFLPICRKNINEFSRRKLRVKRTNQQTIIYIFELPVNFNFESLYSVNSHRFTSISFYCALYVSLG